MAQMLMQRGLDHEAAALEQSHASDRHFLFSKDRLTVAISRARCLAPLICPPNSSTQERAPSRRWTDLGAVLVG